MLLTAVAPFAQRALLQATVRGRRVYGSMEYVDSRGREVLQSLREGLRSEITFQLRLYRRNRGLFSFLGDHLLIEKRVYQVAAFDVFENRYSIQREGRTVGEFEEQSRFLDSFFLLPEIEMGEIEAGQASEYYLLARVRMMPVKIIAPLNIVTLFSPGTAFTTPWIEARLEP
jgi:hypothetical protein